MTDLLIENLAEIATPLGTTPRRGADRPTDGLGPDALVVFDALPAVDRLPMDQICSVAACPPAQPEMAFFIVARM